MLAGQAERSSLRDGTFTDLVVSRKAAKAQSRKSVDWAKCNSIFIALKRKVLQSVATSAWHSSLRLGGFVPLR
jgi:hypothetical protein